MSLYASLCEQMLAKPRFMVDDLAEFRANRLPEMGRVFVGRSGFTDVTHGPQNAVRYVAPAEWPWTMRHVVPEYLAGQLEAAGRRHALNHHSEMALLDLGAPLFYFGGVFEGDWAYVDINRAHYSIYSQLGTYNPAVVIREDRIRIGGGSVQLDEVEMFKGDRDSRNALAGFARARRHHELHFGQFVAVEGPMRYTSPSLWAVIALVLNSVALDAVEHFAAIYAYTDGFIVPSPARGWLPRVPEDVGPVGPREGGGRHGSWPWQLRPRRLPRPLSDRLRALPLVGEHQPGSA